MNILFLSPFDCFATITADNISGTEVPAAKKVSPINTYMKI